MFKKWIYSLAAVLLAMSVLGAAVVPALAKATVTNEAKDKETSETEIVVGKPISLYSGRGGVFFPNPHLNGTMSLSPVDISIMSKPEGVVVWSGSFNIMAENSQLLTQNAKDSELQSFTDRGVVFFDLPFGWEQRALKNKSVAIYYMANGKWQRLATQEVSSSATMPRVGASFAGEGIYALGIDAPLKP